MCRKCWFVFSKTAVNKYLTVKAPLPLNLTILKIFIFMTPQKDVLWVVLRQHEAHLEDLSYSINVNDLKWCLYGQTWSKSQFQINKSEFNVYLCVQASKTSTGCGDLVHPDKDRFRGVWVMSWTKSFVLASKTLWCTLSVPAELYNQKTTFHTLFHTFLYIIWPWILSHVLRTSQMEEIPSGYNKYPSFLERSVGYK